MEPASDIRTGRVLDLDILRRELGDVGPVTIGAADVEPFLETRVALEDRRTRGLHAGMAFTFRDPETATDLTRTYPWARSVVAVAYAYGAGPRRAESGPVVARFARPDAYRGLRSALDRIAAVIRRRGYRAEPVADSSHLVDRAAAVRAGIAWWGKSTMALVPGAGPWALLGGVVTDADVPPSRPTARSCGSCTACIPACPTGAIVAPGILDARRCLSAVLQRPGAIPRELRVAVGGRLYGCDDCLEACPPGRRASAGADPSDPIDLIEVLGADDADLLDRFSHWYLPARNPRYVRRNALVVAGNIAGRAALPIVGGFLGHPDPLLRLHAAWATGRIGGRRGLAALQVALAGETDVEVRAEIESAIATAVATTVANIAAPSGTSRLASEGGRNALISAT